MIRIHEVGSGPAQRLHRGIGLGAEVLRLRAHESVLAVRLVPNRMKRHAALGGGLDGGELGLALVGETVAHADCETGKFFHGW